MENWLSSPYTNVHSTNASNVNNPTSAVCKTVPKPCNLRILTSSDPRTFYAKTVVWRNWGTDQRCVRSTVTSLSTSSACIAAPWQCSSAQVVLILSALPATMTPWQETSVLRHNARVAINAHLDYIDTLLLVITQSIPDFRWVAVYADQKSLLWFRIMTRQASASITRCVEIWYSALIMSKATTLAERWEYIELHRSISNMGKRESRVPSFDTTLRLKIPFSIFLIIKFFNLKQANI